MASKRAVKRKLLHRSCTGKRVWDSEAPAERACVDAARARRDRGLRMHPYRCLCCGRWHIGHPPGTLSRNTRRHR